MADAVPQQQQMLQICRFCLCENEENLVAIEDILMLTLAIQDVVRFTGIQVRGINPAFPKLHSVAAKSF